MPPRLPEPLAAVPIHASGNFATADWNWSVEGEPQHKAALDVCAATRRWESSLRHELTTVHDRILHDVQQQASEVQSLLRHWLPPDERLTFEEQGARSRAAGAVADVHGKVPQGDSPPKSPVSPVKSEDADIVGLGSRFKASDQWQSTNSGKSGAVARPPPRLSRQLSVITAKSRPPSLTEHQHDCDTTSRVSSTTSPKVGRKRAADDCPRSPAKMLNEEANPSVISLDDIVNQAGVSDASNGDAYIYSVRVSSNIGDFPSVGEKASFRAWLTRMVRGWQFECICSMVNLSNCATMGVQAHYDVSMAENQGLDTFFFVVEQIFTTWFLMECLIRLFLGGFRSFIPTSSEGRWNFMDAMLVFFTGLLPSWILPLCALAMSKETEGSSVTRPLMVLRAIRLARLVRVFRDVPLLKEAWILIRGLGDSARVLFWTVIVILAVTYGFAICGLNLISTELKKAREGTDSPEDIVRLDSLLLVMGGLDRYMFTLIQVLLGDSFHVYMRDMLIYIPWAWAYFYAYIAVAVLVLMNLVTAIIVENAMETAQNDHERLIMDKMEHQEKERKVLKHLFEMMDTDQSGTLNIDEFRASFQHPVLCKKWTLLDFNADEGNELFSLLDDGDGEIETGEFFEGLKKMKGTAQARDVFKMQRDLARVMLMLDVLVHRVGIGPAEDMKAPGLRTQEANFFSDA